MSHINTSIYSNNLFKPSKSFEFPSTLYKCDFIKFSYYNLKQTNKKQAKFVAFLLRYNLHGLWTEVRDIFLIGTSWQDYEFVEFN